jgi:2-dehydropantoate 2-reductase
MDNTRILVIGAGVNGSICAAGLLKAGIDVTLLARGSRLDFIRERGVVIEDPFKGTRTVARIPAIGELGADDIYEYVLVVTRKNQAIDLLPILAKNKSLSVVFMVNNPSGPDAYVMALGIVARRLTR